MRAALLLVLLALPAGAAPRNIGEPQTLRQDRRNRFGGTDRSLLRILPILPAATANECTGTAVTGTHGEVVTVSRAAGITCTRSDSTTNALGANIPSLNADGLDVGNSTTVSLSNPLTSPTEWCFFETVVPPARSQWVSGTSGPWVLFNVGAFGTANSLTMYYDNSRGIFLNATDSTATSKFIQADDVGLFSGPRRVGVCVSASGSSPQLYLDGIAVASHVFSGSGTATFTAQPSTVQFGGVGAGFPSNLSVYDVCFTAPSNVVACSSGHISRFTATKRIAVLGDSITGGIGALTPYPQVLETNLASSLKQVDNYGLSGMLTANLLSTWRRYIRGRGYTHLVVLGGVNDIIQSGTAATTFATLSTIYAEARAEGLILVPTTVMPFDAAATWTAGKETQRASLNSSITSYCTANGLTCWDAATLVKDGVDPAKLSATYDSGDGLHPNQAGHNAMATSLQSIVGP